MQVPLRLCETTATASPLNAIVALGASNLLTGVVPTHAGRGGVSATRGNEGGGRPLRGGAGGGWRRWWVDYRADGVAWIALPPEAGCAGKRLSCTRWDGVLSLQPLGVISSGDGIECWLLCAVTAVLVLGVMMVCGVCRWRSVCCELKQM